MIFDHLHRIPQATHLLQLCCQDVMSRGSISFNYAHFSSIYMSAARSFLCTKILCSWDFTGKMCFFFAFPPPPYKVLCVPTAMPGHYISFSMLLYQTMTSPRSNCFQTRRGLSFHSIFRFLAQASVAQDPAKADNQERCMMSCRQSMQRPNLATKFPGSCSSLCRFLRCLSSALSFFILFAMGKSNFASLIMFGCFVCGNPPDKGVCL